VSGAQFTGNCGIGGTWYVGTGFPSAYRDRYYFADWGQGVIKTLTFDANDKPVALGAFASNTGAVVSIVQNPVDDTLYYISYNYSGASVRQISFTGNRTPLAVASANQHYGVTPLSVQFSSVGSSDPDGQSITYSWNFGDGSPVSTQASPSHTFSAPTGVPTMFVVTLTVTDSGGLSAQATVIVSVNNTPPDVTITTPIDGSFYDPNITSNINLTASTSDAESSDSQLAISGR
jgi:PKD repeat protein